MKPSIVFRGMHAGSLRRLAGEFFPARRSRQPATGRSRKRAAAAPDVMGGLCVAVFVAFMLAFLV